MYIYAYGSQVNYPSFLQRVSYHVIPCSGSGCRFARGSADFMNEILFKGGKKRCFCEMLEPICFFCETNDLKFRTHLRHTSMNLVYKRLKVVVGILDSNKNAWKNQVGNHQAIHERTGYLGSVRRKSFGNPSGKPPKTWRPISILGIHLFLVIWQMWEKILTVHKGWYWGEKRSQHILINHVLWRFGMI